MNSVNIPRTVWSKTFDPEMIEDSRTFDMVATVVHCGTLVDGHYMFVEPTESGCRIFDDDSVIGLVDGE
jgi:ubiquitin C-terminal hydrolase